MEKLKIIVVIIKFNKILLIESKILKVNKNFFKIHGLKPAGSISLTWFPLAVNSLP